LTNFRKKTIKDVDVSNKTILLRVDYNVQDDIGVLLDDLRLRESLPTIKYLIENNAKVVICSHRGRPRGKFNPALSNLPVAKHLSQLLNQTVNFADNAFGDVTSNAIDSMNFGDILLLENIRFYKGETENLDSFAEELSTPFNLYVNDAFGACHREHASIAAITKHLPSVAGFLLEKEVSILENATKDPEKPLGIILGGAKISDKIRILENLIPNANTLCIGGAIANTFLLAQGYDVADSLVDESFVDAAINCIDLAKNNNVDLIIPDEVIVTVGQGAENLIRTVAVDQIPAGWRVLDVGPSTIDKFKNSLKESKTLIWNGPMGMFEQEQFAKGSLEIARMIGSLNIPTSVIGGGETAAIANLAKIKDQVTHISTGGGASLMLLKGDPLPGIESLMD
jgi:phosphoglycerate kinase